MRSTAAGFLLDSACVVESGCAVNVEGKLMTTRSARIGMCFRADTDLGPLEAELVLPSR